MTLLPINLPKGFVPSVSVGDKIEAGQSIAKKTRAQETIVHVTTDLNADPKNFEKSLKKNVGDGVAVGDIIAIKKKLVGSNKLLSKNSGTISRIDQEHGDVYITSHDANISENIFSPVEGIVDFCNNEKIVVKTDKNAVAAIDALGEDITGQLLVEDEKTEETEISGKIIAKDSINKVFLYKSLSLGVKGIITKSLEDFDYIDFGEIKIDGALFILAEGEFKKIKKYEGKKVLGNVGGKAIIIL